MTSKTGKHRLDVATVGLDRLQLAVICSLLFLPALLHAAGGYTPAAVSPPKIQREYRAAWIATVGNIDWPSSKDLSTDEQKAELLALFDRAVQLKLNVMIFQVRPACDALYGSKIEPWSEYLTGSMGKPPAPYYDPLEFAISEAHKRGLELHAWFNPYRARHPNAKSPISSGHIAKQRPGLVKEYGSYLWLDPGEKDVQDHSLRVVMDVVKRYDVDGIHFDDYFYPYKERNERGEIDFPDDTSWAKYGQRSGLSRDDWRRENVNTFVRRTYASIKETKPWVKFGVSPFGIWRPKFPEQIEGFDPYDKLFADSRKWLQEGSLDYFAPQLYWAIAPPEQSFPVLLKWWTQQNKRSRHLVPGLNTTRVREPRSDASARSRERAWKPAEIVSQIQIARNQAGVSGHVHWNMRSLMRSEDLATALSRQVYAEPALVPACTWLSQTSPARPQISMVPQGNAARLEWSATGSTPIAQWVIQADIKGNWTTWVLPGKSSVLKLETLPSKIAVTAVDRFGNASKPAGLKK